MIKGLSPITSGGQELRISSRYQDSQPQAVSEHFNSLRFADCTEREGKSLAGNGSYEGEKLQGIPDSFGLHMPHTALLQPLWDVQKGESVLRLPGFLPLHMMAAPLLSTRQFWLCRLSQYESKTTKYLC